VLLAKQGADVAINFRNKGSRAEAIAAEVHALGRRSLLAKADLTDEGGVNAMALDEGIAASKKAGEDALRSRMPEFEARGLSLAIVSGDMIDGTITPKLLERTQRGLIESRRGQAGVLPTVQEFAVAIVDAAAASGRPNGHVTYVGTTD
jgi:hypothetical protein